MSAPCSSVAQRTDGRSFHPTSSSSSAFPASITSSSDSQTASNDSSYSIQPSSSTSSLSSDSSSSSLHGAAKLKAIFGKRKSSNLSSTIAASTTKVGSNEISSESVESTVLQPSPTPDFSRTSVIFQATSLLPRTSFAGAEISETSPSSSGSSSSGYSESDLIHTATSKTSSSSFASIAKQKKLKPNPSQPSGSINKASDLSTITRFLTVKKAMEI